MNEPQEIDDSQEWSRDTQKLAVLTWISFLSAAAFTMLLFAFVLPALGTVKAISVAWRKGGVDGMSLALLFAGILITGLGVTIGYHRLLTHRSFKTYRLIRWMWMAMGIWTWQPYRILRTSYTG